MCAILFLDHRWEYSKQLYYSRRVITPRHNIWESVRRRSLNEKVICWNYFYKFFFWFSQNQKGKRFSFDCAIRVTSWFLGLLFFCDFLWTFFSDLKMDIDIVSLFTISNILFFLNKFLIIFLIKFSRLMNFPQSKSLVSLY